MMETTSWLVAIASLTFALGSLFALAWSLTSGFETPGRAASEDDAATAHRVRPARG